MHTFIFTPAHRAFALKNVNVRLEVWSRESEIGLAIKAVRSEFLQIGLIYS